MQYSFELYDRDRKTHSEAIAQRKGLTTTLLTDLLIHGEYAELYFVSNEKTQNLQTTVEYNDDILRNLYTKLPRIAQEAFLIEVIGTEVHSSNELESVAVSLQEVIAITKNLMYEESSNDRRLESLIRLYTNLASSRVEFPKDSTAFRQLCDPITVPEKGDINSPGDRILHSVRNFAKKKNPVTGEVIHTGLFSEDVIMVAIDRMLTFLANQEINRLVRIAIAHYYFQYIHAFHDGNGLTGRVISSLLLSDSLHPISAMSFAKGGLLKREEYLSATRITDKLESSGEMNYFIDTFLAILIAGQENRIQSLQTKKEQLEKVTEYFGALKGGRHITSAMEGILLNLGQNRIFDFEPGLSVAELAIQQDCSEYSIRKECAKLRLSEYLEVTKKRPTTYTLHNDFVQRILSMQ